MQKPAHFGRLELAEEPGTMEFLRCCGLAIRRHRAFPQLAIVAAVLLAAQLARPAVAQQAAGITVEEVRQSIERAVKFLKQGQTKAGRDAGVWPDNPAISHGGATPLCTLALLNAGCGPDDKAVARSLKYLRNVNVKDSTTYFLSLQTMVFCTAEPKKDLVLIRRNAQLLERWQKEGERAGMWGYGDRQAPGNGDNSNTQFALLGLYEAERAGVAVSDKVWRQSYDYWKNSQNADGSWGYEPGHGGTGSMTNAGITSMVIAGGELTAGDAKVVGDRVQCCGEQQPNEPIDNALAWLARAFSVHRNPGARSWQLYYLYGLERTGRMTAQRFIGAHDWYREGAQLLVRNQEATGAWIDDSRLDDPNISTAFGLLFLSKGQRPVVLAHLKHRPADDWNRHRSALFNLVSYVERVWERDLTYQVIDPASATVEDLLETPILYLSGSQAPEFSKEEVQRLRQYVDRGGFIFAEQCCGGGSFDQGFRALVKQIFPEPDLALHLLELEHPVWYTEEKVDPQYLRELWGVDVGCRTSLVYCPSDLACYWELARTGRESRYSDVVQAQIKAARSVGINVLAYATNREVQVKNPQLRPPVAARPETFTRGTLYVANLLHPGGCKTAPGALTNLMRLASEKLELPASVDPREVALTDPQLFQYHLVFMHGRTSFRLTPAERKQLRTYLERGGMIFADAICSSKQFADSFRQEMQTVLPEHPLERVPAKHPLFTAQFGGTDLSVVSRRQPESTRDHDPLKASVRQGEPILEGLPLDGHYAVLFSPYDISCALESHASLECEGYIREDAAKIGVNVLLYSLHQ